MPFPRASGVLMHPTSFAGPYGIGDLGHEAYRFVDFLVRSGQRLWQVNPLGPTGYGDSPYSCHSAFAGNPLLIAPDLLVQQDLLSADDLADVPAFPTAAVAFGDVIPWKLALLERAYQRYVDGAGGELRERIETFRTAPHNQVWLPDFALFMALKEHHGGAVWQTWGGGVANREPGALEAWREQLADAVGFHTFVQYLFRQQWVRLKAYANSNGITVLGDVPIFVAYDSADVWANPGLFELHDDGSPIAVAGVPPDYFSPTGQLWGNPLYDWKQLQDTDFRWWIERFKGVLTLVDAVRLDHFRGFEAYWRVPAGQQTAIHGQWVKAPGRLLFETLREELGGLPIMVEDLGVITPEVDALRLGLGLPGMTVLQFAFVEGSDGSYLPHRHLRNSVVYTGTHDNDTTVGWWTTCPEAERKRVVRYVGGDPDPIHWTLIRLAMASVADTALFTMQDVLGLGAEARMNTPGRPSGNWSWRLTPDAKLGPATARLLELSETYQRLG